MIGIARVAPNAAQNAATGLRGAETPQTTSQAPDSLLSPSYLSFSACSACGQPRQPTHVELNALLVESFRTRRESNRRLILEELDRNRPHSATAFWIAHKIYKRHSTFIAPQEVESEFDHLVATGSVQLRVYNRAMVKARLAISRADLIRDLDRLAGPTQPDQCATYYGPTGFAA